MTPPNSSSSLDVLSPPGDSFLSLSSDIEAAYRDYLANYSAVTTLENSYKQNEELWKQMVGVIKASAYVPSRRRRLCRGGRS